MGAGGLALHGLAQQRLESDPKPVPGSGGALSRPAIEAQRRQAADPREFRRRPG